jgi:hypothetical protein
MQSMLRTFLVAGVFALAAKVSRGDSEIVVAIRYLQAKGNSHSQCRDLLWRVDVSIWTKPARYYDPQRTGLKPI